MMGLNKSKYIGFSFKEIIANIIKASMLIALLDIVFYRSFLALIPLFVPGFLYFCNELKFLYKDKQHKVSEEFRELLLLSITCQRAGYSVEKSIADSYGDMVRLYGSDSVICNFIKKIKIAIKNNQPIDILFENAGKDMGIEDINQFGEIYSIAYASSGNMSAIMERSAGILLEKMMIRNNVYILLSERIFEMKIMNSMPVIIIGYISITNPGYFDVMYHNLKGIVLMSLVLLVFIISYIWEQKILDIKI